MIDLALQGGGSHGAFTWGVLDRLLEDDRILIEGICGTSAGAMNSVVLADGLDRKGKEGAREALAHFWAEVSNAGRFSPFQRTPLDRLQGRWTLDYSPGYIFFDLMSRMVSPYEINPLNMNPLRDLIASLVDFEHVRHAEGIKLFVAATNVRTGKQKVFRREEMTADMVMASACLPTIFQAVVIDGEAYWDGGYMGNPALFPLLEECQARDLVLVQINPIARDEVPRRSADIQNRLNEITFNASLLKELRAIAFVVKLLEEKWIRDEYREKLKHVLIHSVRADEALKDLGVATKFVSNWEFLTDLRDRGRETAGRWLAENFDCLGQRSSIDVRTAYLQRGSDRPLTRTT